MATVTKTFTDNNYLVGKATWTVSVTGTNQTVSTSSFTSNDPVVTAKFVYSGRTKGYVWLWLGSNSPYYYTAVFERASGAMASGTTYTIPRKTSSSTTIVTSSLFNSSNKTSRTYNVSLYTPSANLELRDEKNNENYGYYTNTSAINWGTIATITLNAPPTLNATGAYSAPQYTGLGAYTASVASASAQYGGDISSLTLTIGSQTETKTYASPTIENQTVTLTPNVAGTFTPVLTVTDSRGQTTSIQFDPITVQQYIKPSAQFNVYRSDATGARADEGAYGLITANIDHIVGASPLQEPIVQIDGVATSNITWYSDSSLQTAISDWGTLGSPVTVYGLINGSFSTTNSYVVTLIVRDGYEQGDAITQTLSTAFYTIDIKAGGKEIAFGSVANDDLTNYPNGLFKCNMDAVFKDKNGVGRLLFDFLYPVGSYYETSKSQAEFDPNVVWGGTWILETEGQVHVSAGVNYLVSGALTNSNDNGSKDAVVVKHNHAQNPHNHIAFKYKASQLPTGSSGAVRVWDWTHSGDSTAESSDSTAVNIEEGVDGTDKNMMPYIVVYRWHRTA